MSASYDVRIWAIRVRKDRAKPYQVRWKVGAAPPKAKSFSTRGLADSFRSGLIQATRRGEAFDTDTGLPESQHRQQQAMTCYEHTLDYIDMKWPAVSGKSRISIVETLTAVIPALVRSQAGAPDPATMRSALRRWAFVPPRRGDDQPPEIRAALAWIRRNSLPLTALNDDKLVHAVLNVLARRLDGTPAAPDYLGRRRRVLYNALKYAVRAGPRIAGGSELRRSPAWRPPGGVLRLPLLRHASSIRSERAPPGRLHAAPQGLGPPRTEPDQAHRRGSAGPIPATATKTGA